MSFTVDDFQGLLRLLDERPEWRAELRRRLLGDELIELSEPVLEKLGRPVIPFVAGDSINAEATRLAQERDVWCVLGGRVIAP